MNLNSVELSVVLPCLNEEKTVGACVSDSLAFLTRSGISGEVIVADNGSDDQSRQIAASLGAIVIDVPKRGYGAAIAAGIAVSRGRFIIMGDSDQSYEMGKLDAFVDSLRAGNHLVMGNRFKGGIADGAMPPLHRYLGNPVLSFIGRLFFKIKVGDFHCGLRGFDRQAILDLGLRTTGMEFASEMVVRASFGGLRIAEVPTCLLPDQRGRPPHLRTWRDGWRHLRFLLLYSPRWLFLYPGLALGFVAMAFFLLSVAAFEGDRSLRYSIAGLGSAIVATQLLHFAVMSKLLGAHLGLLPGDQRVTRLLKTFPLERALTLSIVTLALGSLLFVAGLSRNGIDALDILSVAVVIIGAQIAANSFIVALIAIEVRTE
jgi:glycosyltransferase involved in cell wall biosynthesis